MRMHFTSRLIDPLTVFSALLAHESLSIDVAFWGTKRRSRFLQISAPHQKRTFADRMLWTVEVCLRHLRTSAASRCSQVCEARMPHEPRSELLLVYNHPV